MKGNEIRESYLRFFEGRDHLRLPSASLVPAGDPTLLFTSAGMAPLKDYYTGRMTPPNRRLASCQKCFRTSDLDLVGDASHLTFFEMLGNFSIGDYFKREAVAWAWEYLTEHLSLPEERLYPTIYLDDDEAFRIWNEEIGIPAERIYRYGEDDNYWGPAGTEGPCGPCSEIHYDRGVEHGCGQPLAPPGEEGGCHPNHGCGRFVELWNLVFTQFYHHPGGERTPLPAPNIDTGMGLDRAAQILQGKESVYETDLFWPIVERVCQIAGKSYGEEDTEAGSTELVEVDRAIRIVAEHARGAAFLIADGVVPGNEGRGYVLRRIIRRAIRFARRLGVQRPFLREVAEATVGLFGHTYPELEEQREFVLRVVALEEERFAEVLERGKDLERTLLVPRRDAMKNYRFWKEELERAPVVDSRDAATAAQAIGVGLSNVKANLVAQIMLSHQASRAYANARDVQTSKPWTLEELVLDAFDRSGLKDVLNKLDAIKGTPTGPGNRQLLQEAMRDYEESLGKFAIVTGSEAFYFYATLGFPPDEMEDMAREYGLDVDMEGFQRELEKAREQSRAGSAFSGDMAILTAYESLGVDKVAFTGYERLAETTRIVGILSDGEPVGRAAEGQELEVVLETTPFYAEMGGQVADTGTIVGPSGRVKVTYVHAPIEGLIVHRGVVVNGEVSLGDEVWAEVDAERRLDIARNHTATHLLHAALRRVLGAHVRQSGSLVTPDRLRFDFTHVVPMSRDELLEVRRIVNDAIRRDLPVTRQETTLTEATGEGALAFFGDKYGERVWEVRVGDDETFSLEVCAGTHLNRTGEIGSFHIVSETGIGGGLRRIEAYTGRGVDELLLRNEALLESLSKRLETPVQDLEARLETLQSQMSSIRHQLQIRERLSLRDEAQELLGSVSEVEGVKVLAERFSATSIESLREVGDWLRDKLGSGVIGLGAILDDRPALVVMVTPDLVERGLHAGRIAGEAAKVMGGGGGGRPRIAQAGGRDKEKLDEALRTVPELVRRTLS